jgi:hypothetical protein
MSELDSLINSVTADQNAPTADLPEVKKISEKKAGKPVKRGRGRPRKNNKPQNSIIPDDLGIPEQGAEESVNPEIDLNKSLNRKNAAKGATMLVQTSGMIIAGQDALMPQDEFLNVEENFNRYFEAKDISDFPPGISLGLALGGYYVRVLTTEKSRPKIARLFDWVRSKFTSFRKKQPPQPAQGNDGAQSDTGNDAIG